jgi:SAM-dependent methyltransferase
MAEYTLAQEGAEEAERARLSLLEQISDPHTIRQLDAIGVGEGWRCLDVGAGAGSVTRLLAERVGDAGSVLAVDLDVRLLVPLEGGRITVRRHDLLAEPLPEAPFDLVHARQLLMHLPGRLDALNRLVAAVRRGGWLAVCEPDFNALAISPPSPAWRRAWTAFCDAAVAGGWDPGYGARLMSDLQALELADLEGETVARYVRGGSVSGRLFADSLERLKERMLALGAAEDDLAVAQRQLRDPSVMFHTPIFTTAWGRRPEHGDHPGTPQPGPRRQSPGSR